eukprot:1694918-Pleurochrysis_carterae.AAC.1
MPDARAKGALPCAWRALFGACEKQATNECNNCRFAEALPHDKRPAVPQGVEANVRAACSPALLGAIPQQ